MDAIKTINRQVLPVVLRDFSSKKTTPILFRPGVFEGYIKNCLEYTR
jgi:hypothetical protein